MASGPKPPKKTNRKNNNPEQTSKVTVQRLGLYCRNSTLVTFDGTTDYHNHRLLTSFPLFSLHSPPNHSSAGPAAPCNNNSSSSSRRLTVSIQGKRVTPGVYWPFSRRCAVPFLAALCEESVKEEEQQKIKELESQVYWGRGLKGSETVKRFCFLEWGGKKKQQRGATCHMTYQA